MNDQDKPERPEDRKRREDEQLDKTLEESFPSSDPPAWPASSASPQTEEPGADSDQPPRPKEEREDEDD